MNPNAESPTLEATFHLYDSKRFADCTDALMRYDDRGNAEAQYRLALLFENGCWQESGDPYIPAALFYHYRAAAQNHVLAQVGLAALLEEFGCVNEAVIPGALAVWPQKVPVVEGRSYPGWAMGVDDAGNIIRIIIVIGINNHDNHIGHHLRCRRSIRFQRRH